MAHARFQSVVDLVCAALRDELLKGRWTRLMPGRERLAQEWGVSDKTIEAAMEILEKEGLLAGQGAGRRRRVTLSQENLHARELRVGKLVVRKAF